MQFILFTKTLKELSAADHIKKAHAIGADGYDLCIRPGFKAVNPDNMATALPAFATDCRKDGLAVPMITTNLLDPDDAASAAFFKAMDQADVRLVKLAYYYFGRHRNTGYWDHVDALKRTFAKWQKLAATYKVKVLYHTHSSDENGPNYMGENASNMMHFIKGLDPALVGVYLDPAHLRAEGEQFDFAVGIAAEYLAAVGLKDLALKWDDKHYRVCRDFCCAGQGMVEWDLVMSELVRIGFHGPMSVHAEYASANEREFFAQLPREIAFFKAQFAKAVKENKPKYEALIGKW